MEKIKMIEDPREEITDLEETIRRLRAEVYSQKRMIDKLTESNKDLRKLNAYLREMLEDMPVRRNSLREAIKIQADQITQMEHRLKMAQNKDLRVDKIWRNTLCCRLEIWK